MAISLPQITANDPNFQYQVAGLLNKLTTDVALKSDLVAAGVIDTAGAGSTGTIIMPTSGTIIATPLAITNLKANGGFATIMLTWDSVTQFGFAYVEIYRNTIDDLATAVKLGTSVAPMYTDIPPNNLTSVTYYYWARAVNTSGIAGPYNAISGTQGSTANDPAYALEILSGQITQSHLFGALSNTIDLIPLQGNSIVALQNSSAAQSQTLNSLSTTVGTNISSIVSLQTTTQATATSLTQLSTTVGTNTSSIQQQLTSISGIEAQYSLTIDVNGHVAGFGLIAGGGTSDFIVSADRFSVVAPNPGATPMLPFVVDAVTGITHIQGASIQDATITNAKMGWVSGDVINVSLLLTAPIISGGMIRLGGAVSLSAGTGIILNGGVGTGAFRVGDPLAEHIKWDGLALRITGQIIASASSSMAYSSVTGGPPANSDHTVTTINGGVVTTGFIDLDNGGNNVFRVRGQPLVKGSVYNKGATLIHSYSASGPSQLSVIAKVGVGATNGTVYLYIDGVLIDSSVAQNTAGVAVTLTLVGEKVTLSMGQVVTLEIRATGSFYAALYGIVFDVFEVLK